MASESKHESTLLVHHGAPATVKHDRKWQAIAENVVNFKAQKVTALSRVPMRVSITPTSYQPCQIFEAVVDDGSLPSPAEYIPPSQSSLDDNMTEIIDIEELLTTQRYQRMSDSISWKVHKGYTPSSLSKSCSRAGRHAYGMAYSRTKQGLNPRFRRPHQAYRDYTTELQPREELIESFATDAAPRENLTKIMDTTVLVPRSVDEYNKSRPSPGPTPTVNNTSSSKRLLDKGDSFGCSHKHKRRAVCAETLASKLEKSAGDSNSSFSNTSSRGFHSSLNYSFSTHVCSSRRTINSLPLRIESKILPRRASDCTVTAIPKYLHRLANQQKLWQRFKPTEVLRDAHSMERGYWKVSIKVTSPVIAAVSKFPPQTISQLSDVRFLLRKAKNMPIKPFTMTPGDDLSIITSNKTLALWVESDFIRFFEKLEAFILKGHAGWATRAILASRRATNNATELELRIYTFGHILAHMWLALWHLSDGLIASGPMEWMGSDGNAIVRMSAKPTKTGHLRQRN